MKYRFPHRIHHHLITLVLILIVSAGSWSFIELADEVLEGETMSLDRSILLSMREADDQSDLWGPKWLEETGRDLTSLGGIAVLALLGLGVAGFLILDNKPRTALFLVVSIGGALLISQLLKSEFVRPRPDLVPHESVVYTKSFPSGHSMLAAATYLTLAVLLSRVLQRPRLQAYVLFLAVFFTVLVGVSRVYLGVHWPTDVLAGWTSGAVWAVVCLLVLRILQKKRIVEAEPLEDAD
ncbi:MAG: phosphatase PAP2 family protein [Desulfohalobiaceae bacterium]|nr:phosphatase PAP2 family protein [Desulfohalobiaceae bacterium]